MPARGGKGRKMPRLHSYQSLRNTLEMGVRRAVWVAGVVQVLLVLPCRLQADAVAEGARLYQRQCAACHGPSGRGDGPSAKTYTAAPRNLQEGFLDAYSTEELVQRLRDGTPLQIALDASALRARAADTDAVLEHLRRLANSEWERLSRGWDLYVKRCDSCHDLYGHPSKTLPAGVGAPRDLASPEFQKQISDRALLGAVRHGRSGMPALVPRVTEGEAQALASYVRLLSPGFEVYSRHCANCHGDDGRGIGRLGEELGQPTVVFDRDYFAHHEVEELRMKIWHMLGREKPAMPHYRWTLSEEQARAVVGYLRSFTAANGAAIRAPRPGRQ